MPTDKGPADSVVAAWQALLRAHTVLTEELDRDLREAHGVPLAWYDVLFQLSEAGGTATMGDLTRTLLIGGSRGTRRVDQMEAAGLVERHRNHVDARVVEVRLTPTGRRVRRRTGATHLAGIQRVLGRFLAPELAEAMTAALDAAAYGVGQSRAARS